MNNLIALVGPTASGKTDLAIELAKEFDGEIVCADSRTVFKGMDIGTAKPGPEQLLQIKHHLLDIVEPGQTLGAAEFKRLADLVIKDIQSRGKLPFLVGGSGLYIDAILYDFQFPAVADPALRQSLEALDNDQLLERLESVDPEAAAAVDQHNRRRLIRAIETAGQPRSRSNLRPGTLLLGLRVNQAVLQNRITTRVDNMLAKGFLKEVQKIGSDFGWDSEAMTSIGYRAFKDVIVGQKSIDAAKADFVRGDLMLAKKQMTWFKRNPDILWMEADNPKQTLREALTRVKEFMASS